MRTFPVSQLFSFADVCGEEYLRAVFASYDGGLIVASSTTPLIPIERGYDVPPHVRANGDTFRIQHICGKTVQSVTISGVYSVCPDIQPLGPGKWFFVYGDTELGQNNAAVYDSQGNLLYTTFVGDGVKDVQTTANGSEIWISYSDQGIFGSSGPPTSPSGAGIVCFGSDGQIRFRFDEKVVELGFAPPMDDCYVLNVCDNNNVYACYYGPFLLVLLQNRRFVRSWQARPACAVAVTNRYALFAPAYIPNPFFLLDLYDERPLEDVLLVTDNGTILQTGRYYTPPHRGVFGRDSRMYVRDEDALYCLDLAQLPELA